MLASHDVVVVGGGQAGLAAGYYLRRAGVDLAAATGVSRDRLVGAFAGLTRLLKADFDYARLGPPFDKTTHQLAPRRKENSYRLSEEQAARWRLARQP